MVGPSQASERQRTVEEALAELLHERGRGVAFGLIGDDVARLVARLAAMPGFGYFSSRHETAAVMMADGYSRTTGQLAVCIVSRGPGFTNALTGIVAARKAGSALLVLVGDTSESGGEAARLHPKHAEQVALAEACGALTYRVTSAATALETVGEAADAAAGGRVVVVNVATDVLEQPIPERPVPAPVQRVAAEPEAPAAADLAALAEALMRSERPVLIAGRGAIAAGADGELADLAGELGALLGTTLPVKDLFTEHPQNIGVVGGFAHNLARELLAEADCVVSFGAGLNAFTAGGGKLFADADVYQVALEAPASGLSWKRHRMIRGDAHLVARELRDALRDSRHAAHGWGDTVFERLAGYDPAEEIDDRSTASATDPRALLAALNETLPRERAVVLDSGHFTGFAATYLDTAGPPRFTACLDYAAIGLGLGTALGVSIADSSIRTLLVIGDGALLMSLGELDTAARYELPITIVVVNDAAYGAELHYLALNGVASAAETTTFEQRDFAAVGASLGITTFLVQTLEQAREAARSSQGVRGPVLIDCRVLRDVRAQWLEELFGDSGATFGR
jgi:acetolactate synthase-1/2/3 large subunit